MSIAVIILTYNEEINLQRCLDSVAWADERLIVDSGSQDKTLEIAKRNAVPVLQRCAVPFLISEQRNFALDNGRLYSDWVLFVDADEVVTERLRQQIVETLNTNAGDIVAYRLLARFMFLERGLKHCQGMPWHDRLLLRDKVRYIGGVWEAFDTAESIGHLSEPYLHYSVSKGVGDWFLKHERYATVEANDIAQTLGILPSDKALYQKTSRKRHMRDLAARIWPFRPLLRFLVMYIVRLGFLDGLAGLLYCLMISTYELMIVLKVIELKQQAQQKYT